MLLVRIGWKSANPTTDVAFCNTSGWAKIGQFYDGNGASSNGGGGVLVAAFWKVATSASETNPVIEFDDSTSPTPGCWSAVTYAKGSTETWDTPVGDGGGIAAATNYSATIQSHISAKSGDMLDAFAVTNDNTTLTVPTVAQTGLTLDTVTEYPATALSSGTSNDISADGCNRLATAGTSSAAAVVSGTNSVADTGAAWVTRLRVYQGISPALLDQTAVATAPSVITNQTISPALLDRTAVATAPTISTTYTATLNLIDQSAQPTAPTVTTSNTVTLALIDQSAVATAPTITTTNTITLSLIDQTASPTAPTITTQNSIVLSLIDQTAVITAPTISQVGGGPDTITLSLIDQTASPTAPTITTSATVSLSLLDQTAAATAPTITLSTQQVFLSLIDQTAIATAPTISGGASAGRPRLRATVTVRPNSQTIAMSLLDQRATAHAPSVEVNDDDVVLELLLT